MTNARRWGLRPAYLGEGKKPLGEKRKKARFAVALDELLRGRLIRDLIICCEKKGENERVTVSTSFEARR